MIAACVRRRRIISPGKPSQQQIHLVVRFLFHLNQNAAL
jgi:hypothetical protein